MRRLSFLLLLSSVIIFHPISLYAYGTHEVKRVSLHQLEPAFRLYNEEPALNLSRVHIIYSNVFLLGRTDYSTCISFTLGGPYKQTGWLVLISPWKPLRITSNNVDQPFVELDYHPQTMEINPIVNTTHSYAWDYDAGNQVVFMKFLLAPTVTITMYYPIYIPKITEFASGKLSYTTLESVNLWLSIYGNYTALATIDWLARLIIKDSAGKIIQTVDRDFKLSIDQILKFQYDLGTFKEGTYNATAQILDPVTGNVVATDQLTFDVTVAPPSTYSLTITTTGGGTTSPIPGTYTHAESTRITVTAYRDIGYVFDHWKLDGAKHTENPINVTMDANHALLAVFRTAPPIIPLWIICILAALAIIVIGITTYFYYQRRKAAPHKEKDLKREIRKKRTRQPRIDYKRK